MGAKLDILDREQGRSSGASQLCPIKDGSLHHMIAHGSS